VHILYFTVIPDGAGGVRFLDDIYDRDTNVLTGLKKAPAYQLTN
jgi:murein L,D-transpeptidase YcbB/YkuD